MCLSVHRAATVRRGSAKSATPPASPAPVPPRLTAPRVPAEALFSGDTVGPAVGRATSSTPTLVTVSNAVRTVSAALLTSGQRWAVCVCGVELPGCGYWEITVFLSVPRDTMDDTEPVLDATPRVVHVVGRDPSRVRHVPPPSSCRPLVSVPRPAPEGTLIMDKECVRSVTPSASRARLQECARRVGTLTKC